MGGARWGLSGHERVRLAQGAAMAAGVITLVITVNILTRIHDSPGRPAGPLVDEMTSFATALLATAVPAGLGLWIRRRRPGPWRLAAAAVLGLAAFVTLHVGGFVLLRRVAYAWFVGRPYHFGPWLGQLLYETPKEMLGFGLSVGFFWRLLAPPAPEPAASLPPDPPEPAMFDIQDGARWLRTPLAEILAIRSAGNYAEFLLADGRRPLMRTSLSALEQALRPAGFVRTHRSWLVNASQVTGLRPEGSGDHTVELAGIEVPLSRRYREAISVIRG